MNYPLHRLDSRSSGFCPGSSSPCPLLLCSTFRHLSSGRLRLSRTWYGCLCCVCLYLLPPTHLRPTNWEERRRLWRQNSFDQSCSFSQQTSWSIHSWHNGNNETRLSWLLCWSRILLSYILSCCSNLVQDDLSHHTSCLTG